MVTSTEEKIEKQTLNKSAGSEKVKISIKDLCVVLGGRLILDNVSLDILDGKTVAIMGMSGTGKSTLIRSIIRLLEPESGEIIIDNQNILKIDRNALYNVRQKIGMVFQNAALFDSMTISENVGFGLKEHSKLADDEIRKIVSGNLKIVDLEGRENSMPSELSGGMQKRASIARAITTSPEIVLYDEPTAGLDPIIGNTINKLIRDMQRRFKVTSIVVTHDLESAYTVADEIAMLHKGKIIEMGTPEKFRQSANPIVRQFLNGSHEGPVKV